MRSLLSWILATLALPCSVLCGCAQDSHLVIPPPDPDSGKTDPQGQEGEPEGVLENDATRRTLEMGLGWNLGNQLDAVLRGWFTEDPAYTLQSVYNQAPVF